MNAIETQNKNKEAISYLYENILNNRKFELIDELVSNEYRNPKGTIGADGYRELVLPLVKAFPDARWTILEMVAEGNKLIANVQLEGTNTGPFQNFAPTGKKISYNSFSAYEFKNGKIINNHVQTDRLAFLQKLEILPADLNAFQSKKESKESVSLIDKFFIPRNSIPEFSAQLQINKKFIKTLPGFIRIEEFEHKDEAGNLNFVTVAFWEKQSSVDSAKAAVQTEFKRTGFNPVDFYERLNIKLERGLYNLNNN
jgi:predicted ester cyclase/heme-degrading monooxygenase HmoA